MLVAALIAPPSANLCEGLNTHGWVLEPGTPVGFTRLQQDIVQIHVEFPTVCRYELPIKVIVNNNASLGQILWELLALGYPELGIAFEHRPDFAPWARACGGVGIRVDTADGLEAATGEAFAHPGAALVDVTVSPDEPPLPVKVEPEQAGFVKSLLSGQPRKKEIAGNLIRDKLAEIQN
jgi:pyruvate dehydrogenase (quinone)